MTFTYEIGVRIPLRHLLKPVDDLEKEINKTMAGFGFNEKLTMTSVLPLELTVQREPTKEQLDSMLEIVRKEFREKMGLAEIEYVRRMP